MVHLLKRIDWRKYMKIIVLSKLSQLKLLATLILRWREAITSLPWVPVGVHLTICVLALISYWCELWMSWTTAPSTDLFLTDILDFGLAEKRSLNSYSNSISHVIRTPCVSLRFTTSKLFMFFSVEESTCTFKQRT